MATDGSEVQQRGPVCLGRNVLLELFAGQKICTDGSAGNNRSCQGLSLTGQAPLHIDGGARPLGRVNGGIRNKPRDTQSTA